MKKEWTMRESLLAFLSPVRHRCQVRAAAQAVVVGMIGGSCACIVLALARPQREGAILGLAALVVGPVLGALAAFAGRPSWAATATLVDDHYGLKDGTTSALEFSTSLRPSPLAALQIQRASRRLAIVRPADVVPLRAPRGWPIALGCLIVAIGFVTWPLVSVRVRAEDPAVRPFDPALQEAKKLEEDVRVLQAAASEMPDPVLDAMIERMQQTIAELKQPGLDMRETMAKLSALEAAIAAQQRELKVGAADRQLQSLGSALAEARPLEPAGKALQESRFDQAANELESAGAARIEDREARAVQARAAEAAKEMQAKGLERLGQAALKMANGVRQGGQSQRQGASELAKEVRDHERRRRINQLMAQEQRRLKDCKDRCATRNLMLRQINEESAKSANPSSGSDKSKPAQADASRKTDELEKSAQGPRERLSGLVDRGPSDVVDSQEVSADGAKSAGKPSQKRMQKYQRLSEAALDSEPIPLGHRQSIRRYFELIRPAAGAESTTANSAQSPDAPGP
jgi:hypothetical protein